MRARLRARERERIELYFQAQIISIDEAKSSLVLTGNTHLSNAECINVFGLLYCCCCCGGGCRRMCVRFFFKFALFIFIVPVIFVSLSQAQVLTRSAVLNWTELNCALLCCVVLCVAHMAPSHHLHFRLFSQFCVVQEIYCRIIPPLLLLLL